ncbi:hypothetical protein [Kitasatospora sp. NPDC057198]|uniref:hypothetical protein n=1 Tax=Kitasatospora sp. NPDC057198 TaxID=3346046 RepID=UPI0036398E39
MSAQQSEHEFEERLTRAFRAAGEGFLADPPRLARQGAVRGRRRQRGQLSLVAGASALVLAVGALTALSVPAQRPAVAVGPAASVPSPTGGTAAGAALPEELHTVSVLGEVLPPGVRILRSSGTTHGPGTVPSSSATAQLLVDNGSGPSRLSVTVDDWKHAKPGFGCTGSADDRICTETPDGDGGRVFATASLPDAESAFREVSLEAADGLRVTLHSGSPDPDAGAPALRPAALLTEQQLTGMLSAPSWRSLRGALAQQQPARDTHPAPDVRLADLLPAGLRVEQIGGSWSQQSATVGEGGREAELLVEVAAADQVTREWFGQAPVLPDGTRIRTAADRPVPHAQGATETVVALLRPSGLLMRVTVANPGGGGLPLTERQVEALALSPAWSVLDRG